jgi:hypothetical protein
MNDHVLKTIESPDGRERILIVRRTDGVHSCRRQWLSAEMNSDPDSPIFERGEVLEGQWGAPGPYCGLYDAADIAEQETQGRVPWLRADQLP